MELRQAGRIQADMRRPLSAFSTATFCEVGGFRLANILSPARCAFLLALSLTLVSQLVLGQDSANASPGTPAETSGNPDPAPSKRIFGIIPNFRTSPDLRNYTPLTPKQKFTIASQDSFDRGTFVLAAVFATQSYWTESNRSFGTGVGAYGHYYATSYGDFMIGNFMTEGIYPTLLHQDPRYFRRGRGTTLSRLGYSAGQIILTHRDLDGAKQFNYSEILGNATGVAISNAYYPEQRNFSDAASKLGTQLGVDMASNILKEFWPDINRHFSSRHPHR